MATAIEFWLYLPQMRFSLDAMIERANAAEAAGFAGIGLMDHLAPPMAESQPMYDAMVTAAVLASATSTLKLGHLVLCDAMRHPAVLAKEVVSLDHLSGGRFELGIGWGSMPAELERFGVGDTGPQKSEPRSWGPRQRVRRLAETLDVLRALWTGDVVDFDGEFHQLRGAQQQPVPLAPIPIVIGGSGPATMRLVAAHADWWNVTLSTHRHLAERRQEAGDARLSAQVMVAPVFDESARADITATATRRFGGYGDGLVVGTPDELAERFGELAGLGVERLYVWFADFAPPSTLAAFGDAVIAPFTNATTATQRVGNTTSRGELS